MAGGTGDHTSETKKLKSKAKASLALLVIAVISISTATYAWFSLSNSTSVQSMIVEVSTGVSLKAYAGIPGTADSTDPAKYFSVILSEGTTTGRAGEVITEALPSGVDLLSDVKLWPVTSGDGAKLYTQGTNVPPANDGIAPERKYYLHLTLTFLAGTDMDVYLNGAPSATTATDGTLVAAETIGDTADEEAVNALRVSFTDEFTDVTKIYEPGWDGTATTLDGNALVDAGSATQPVFDQLGDNTGRYKGDPFKESPVLFSLKKGVPRQVTIRMWVEGQDPQCVNGALVDGQNVNIEAGRLTVRLRFSGADKDGRYLETPTD